MYSVPAYQVSKVMGLGYAWAHLTYPVAPPMHAGGGLGLRVYRPTSPTAAGTTTNGGGRSNRKLPVMVAFHGGGFCTNCYTTPHFHVACTRLAAGVDMLILSSNYPKHRLSASINDAVLLWLRGHACPFPELVPTTPTPGWQSSTTWVGSSSLESRLVVFS